MSRSSRFWLTFAAATVAVVVIVAAASDAWFEPVNAHLRIGADKANSEPFEVASSVAQVVRRTYPGIDIEVVPTSGSNENIKLLGEGKLDLALVQANVVARENVSLLAIFYPEAFQLVVRQASAIYTVKDLEGARIALPPVNSEQYRAFWFLANHYGLSPEKIDAIPMGEIEADRAMLDGTVDAVFRVRGPRNERLRSIINQIPVRMIALDQGAAMHLRQPAFRASTIPKGAYRGDPAVPPFDLPTVAVDRLLMANAGLDEDVVRAITTVLFEKQRDLLLRTPLATFIHQPSIEAGTLLPVHPGARDYFDRDEPSLLEQKSEFFALLLSLAVVLGSVIVALKRRLDASKKVRIEDYTVKLIDLEREARQAGTVTELNTYKERMTQILSQVVNDMHDNRINAEGLQLFAFTWESVNYQINDHEEQLRLGPGPAAADGGSGGAPDAGTGPQLVRTRNHAQKRRRRIAPTSANAN